MLTFLHTGDIRLSGTLKNGKLIDNYFRKMQKQKKIIIGLLICILLILVCVFIKYVLAVIGLFLVIAMMRGMYDNKKV